MLPSDKAKLDGSCMGNITSRSAQGHEKGAKEATEKIHKVKEAQFSLKCWSSLQQRREALMGTWWLKKQIQGQKEIRKPGEELAHVKRWNQELARFTRL